MVQKTRRSALALNILLGAGLFLFTACDGCGNEGTGEVFSGSLLATPDPISFAQVEIGKSAEQSLTLSNTASDPLRIFQIALQPQEGGSIDGIELVDLPAASEQTPIEIAPQSSIDLLVRYSPTSPVGSRAAVRIRSSDPSNGEVVVNINTLDSLPQLSAIPNPLRFTKRPLGSDDTQEVLLRNFGKSDLIIFEAPSYSGGADFTAQWSMGGYPKTIKVYDADLAAQNASAYELALPIKYRPQGNSADSGEILVISNDTSQLDPTNENRGLQTIPVQASSDAPCILIDQVVRNFGQVGVGATSGDAVIIENCGNRNLEVNDIRISKNSDGDEFELDLLGADANNDGALDQDLEIEPGERANFLLKYTPEEEGTDTGTVLIFSNDPVTPELEVALVARGAIGVPPVAVAGGLIKGSGVAPRQTVAAIPLQTIVFDGSQSFDMDGFIPLENENWKWKILEKPADAVVSLEPLPEAPDDPTRRQLRLLLAGDYVVELSVVDNDNFESQSDEGTNTHIVRVSAVPNEKILVELTWTNPEDADESNNVGSDVDLHMVKMGPGKWFEAPYDIYFRNPNNGPGNDNNGYWGPESPSLDIDDIDGAGPENVQMNDPQNCEWYALGVHYYRQFFGTAYVTVRVYVDGRLVFEELNRPMQRGGEFWDVARIHWDSGQIQLVDELYPAAPMGQDPKVTTMGDGLVNMAGSGLCTAASLY